MKEKKHPRGPWQAIGMQKARLPKRDPAKLRMRATDLKLKAESLIKDADELEQLADALEQESKHSN